MNNGASDQLQLIFNNVNDWLKFAEAKNGAVAFVGVALIAGALAFLAAKEINQLLLIYFVMMIVFSGFSVIVALMSFLPTTRIPWLRKPAQVSERNNVLFFRHIASHDIETYLELLKEAMEEEQKPSGINKAYIEQIIVNSKIASKKYDYFTTAVFLLITAFVTLVGSLILFLILTVSSND